MRRLPIAHIIFPQPNPVRPVSEFTWDAVRRMRDTRGLDLEVLMPVPVRSMGPLQKISRTLKGAATWDRAAYEALGELDPRPTLIPYVPAPARSIEAATAVMAAHLIARRRARRPAMIQGSFLDVGGYAAALLGRALKCPSIAVAHGTDVRMARDRDADPGRHRRSISTIRNASEVVAVSSELSQQLAMLGRRAPVIRYTAEPDQFPLASAPPEPRTILFVGRISRAKGVDLLLRAFAELSLSDVRLELVGPVEKRYDVVTDIEQLRLTDRVSLLGELPREHLPEVYARSHCLVLPSRSEGLACVLVESLLTGRPVVATDVGGTRELVTDDVGAIVAPEDPRALAAGIDQVLTRYGEDGWNRKRLRKRARDFSWERSAKDLRTLTWSLLEDA